MELFRGGNNKSTNMESYLIQHQHPKISDFPSSTDARLNRIAIDNSMRTATLESRSTVAAMAKAHELWNMQKTEPTASILKEALVGGSIFDKETLLPHLHQYNILLTKHIITSIVRDISKLDNSISPNAPTSLFQVQSFNGKPKSLVVVKKNSQKNGLLSKRVRRRLWSQTCLRL